MTTPTPPSAMEIAMECTHGRWLGEAQFGACVHCIALALNARDEQIGGLEEIRRADGQAMEKMAQSCDALEAKLRDREAGLGRYLMANNTLVDTLGEREREVERLREAIEYLFTPGPGIAVPEPYPQQEEYEPHKKTWNNKLAKLKEALLPSRCPAPAPKPEASAPPPFRPNYPDPAPDPSLLAHERPEGGGTR